MLALIALVLAAAPAGKTVHGTVVDEQGAGLFGARVYLRGELRGGASVSGEVRTDADGGFSFEQVPVRLESLMLHISRDGNVPTLNYVERTARAGALRFVLAKGHVISGTLSGPLAHEARLELTELDAGSKRERKPLDGGFEFRELRAGPYRLEVKRDGAPPFEVAVDAPAENLAIVLPAGSISGRVVAADGGPGSWAAVGVLTPDQPYRGFWSGRADRDGGFAVPGLADGRYRVRAQDSSLCREQWVVVEKGVGRALVDFRGGFTVRVRVTSADGGPAGVAVVGVRALEGPECDARERRFSAELEFPGLVGDTVEVIAYEPPRPRARPSMRPEPHVGPSRYVLRAPLDAGVLKLVVPGPLPARRLKGVLTATDGKPIASADVDGSITDASGRFTVSLPAGPHQVLYARARCFEPLEFNEAEAHAVVLAPAPCVVVRREGGPRGPIDVDLLRLPRDERVNGCTLAKPGATCAIDVSPGRYAAVGGGARAEVTVVDAGVHELVLRP